MYLFKEAETWVAIAFILFLVILFRLGWSKIVAALDNRSILIKKELDEARNLREQAQSLLADYQRKKRDSEKEISNIIEKAKAENKLTIEITLKKHKELLERRKASAEEKINQAKERAVQEIKESIVDLSISTTQSIITKNFEDSINKKLIKDASLNINKDFVNL